MGASLRLTMTTIWISGILLSACGMDAPEGDPETTAPGTEALKKCSPEGDCTGDPDTLPPGPNYPPPQPQPPSPYGTPLRFSYTGLTGLALGVDAAITTKLSAPLPADNAPWPLAGIPYAPEIATAPVRVESVDTNLWAFSSYDAGGMAVLCAGTCSTAPAILFNANRGTYQATLRMTPRLDIEFWEVATLRNNGVYFLYPRRVAEVTATVHTRAFAECVGWEQGNGRLHAVAGVDDVTIARDTGVLEDIADFFVDGYTDAINQKIRTRIMAMVGVGQFQPLPADGGPCATLGISGDAFSGALTWNEAPLLVRFPAIGFSLGAKPVSP